VPYINCRVMEGVLTPEQKTQIAQRITDTIASVVGEPVRGLTWVVIDDMDSGHLTIGGDPVTTEGVHQLLGHAPATV
jgi:4-oxalocrotonate tautomerase